MLEAYAEALDTVETPDDLANALRYNPTLRRRLERFDSERVWHAVVERKGAGGHGGDPDDLLRPEWETFIDPGSALESEDFRLRESAVPPPSRAGSSRVVVAERLREVIALCGFTRIESQEGERSGEAGGPTMAALANRPPTWVPAAESRGEGIFIQLDEDAVAAWESEMAESDRVIALELSLRRWRERRRLEPGTARAWRARPARAQPRARARSSRSPSNPATARLRFASASTRARTGSRAGRWPASCSTPRLRTRRELSAG